MRTRLDWALMVGGGLLVAALTMLAGALVQHLRADDALLHQVIVPVLQFNVQKGHLEPLPGPVAAEAAPAPGPPVPRCADLPVGSTTPCSGPAPAPAPATPVKKAP